MAHADSAFEAYRTSPPQPVTLPRLAAGLAIIVVCWLATTLIILFPSIMTFGSDIEGLLQSRVGVLSTLGTFIGIWLGAWLAMRFIHREPFRNLRGLGGWVSLSGFWKGFAAVALTSILAELLIYAARPEMARTSIDFTTWLALLAPAAVLTFVQTSAEELLFRGYLLRGLANRFRSPWIWALIPGLAFVALHVSPGMAFEDLVLVVLSIGTLTVALTLTVYWTGNLGAAFGMHFANNLFALTLISHQEDLSGLSLYRGASIENLGSDAWAISAISLLCVGLTVVLLAHRASPLCVRWAAR